MKLLGRARWWRPGGMAAGLAAALLTVAGGEPPPLPPVPPPPPPRAARARQLPAPAPAPTVQPPSAPASAPRGLTGDPFAPAPAPVGIPPSAGPPLAPGVRVIHFPTNQVGPPPVLQPESVFAWDGLLKEHKAATGELTARLTFSLTNMTNVDVTITSVRTSCGCTIAKLPATPWRLGAGSNGTFEVIADLRGKSGILTKTVTVDSTAGYRILQVRIAIPAQPLTLADRARNLQMSMADRQAVFKGNCAVCHVGPASGKRGRELYVASCGVCHEAEHRASMVPNLRALGKPTDPVFWRTVVTKGRPNTLMPAFALGEGGPLSGEQVESLVAYLAGPYQTEPPPTTPAQAATATGGAAASR